VPDTGLSYLTTCFEYSGGLPVTPITAIMISVSGSSMGSITGVDKGSPEGECSGLGSWDVGGVAGVTV